MGEQIYDPSREQEKLVPAASGERLTFWEWLQAPGGARQHPTLCTLVVISFVMGIVMAIGAFMSESMSIVLDASCDAIDFFSYSVNLLCEYVASYSPKEFRVQAEFRAAIISTVFLLLSGTRVLFGAVAQIVCSEDTTWKPGYVPCSYLQERPKPTLVITFAAINLVAYLPVFIVMHFFEKHGSSMPSESINKASAMLHVWSDVCQQVVLILAGVVMLLLQAESVQIDSLASIFVLVFMFTLAIVMWYNYFTKPTQTEADENANHDHAA